ncbi:ATP-binding protein [Streptomyces sp. YGL11-2]|uniref:ATP-binding protein n=1 Tax=Streptomyces sp. YGL11-2 TaxID=3414028 RepID=UPI003CF88B3A
MHPHTAAVARPPLCVSAGARPYLLTAPSSPTTPKAARDFVRSVLRRGPLAPLLDTAVLLTSEAVTTSHLRTPAPADILLRVLTAGHGLRISVHDEPPAAVRLPAPSPENPRHVPLQGAPQVPPGDRDPAHGLLLISRLADDWGMTPFAGPPRSASLWFALHTPC